MQMITFNVCIRKEEGKKGGHVLFNDALNTFVDLRLFDVKKERKKERMNEKDRDRDIQQQ